MGGLNLLKKGAFALVCLTFIGCAKSTHINYKKQAPTKQSEVGVIYKATSPEMVSELEGKFEGLELRPLNKKHNLYEAYGVSVEELKKYDPDAIVQLNQVYTRKQDNTNNNKSTLREQISNFLSQCPDQSKLSKAILSLGTVPQYGNTFDISQVINIQNHMSQVMKRTFWVVAPPTGSELDMQPKLTKELLFQPDMTGTYTIYQLAEDLAGNCYKSSGDLMVTANPEYVPTTGQYLEAVPTELFYQLQDIEAEGAWAQTKGENTFIAIINTGVNYNHPAISPNIKTNDAEIPDNGIDDDDNGLVDDYVGYDFVFNDTKPFDDNGHGSHVAGLAASYSFGVAPRAKILPIKAMSAMGTGDLGSIAAAIYYAIDQKVDVINLSLSFEGSERPLWNLIFKTAEQNGITIVTAAGNGDVNTGIGYSLDERPNYPANYSFSNVITVAASAKESLITSYSNYSNHVVDVIAPGGSQKNPLISAYIENPKNFLLVPKQGTSMAAPVVAGVVALMKSKAPGLTPSQIREILVESGTEYPDLRPLVASSRALNAKDAVYNTHSLFYGFDLANSQ